MEKNNKSSIENVSDQDEVVYTNSKNPPPTPKKSKPKKVVKPKPIKELTKKEAPIKTGQPMPSIEEDVKSKSKSKEADLDNPLTDPNKPFTGHYCHKCLGKIYEDNLKVKKGENNTVAYAHKKCPKGNIEQQKKVVKIIFLLLIAGVVIFFNVFFIGMAMG